MLPVTHLATSRMCFAALMVKNICGDVVKCAVNDSTVHGIFETDMVFVGRELGSANITIDMEFDLQSYGVVHPTGKTHRCSFKLIGHWRSSQGTC